jgi:hypothetical protein
VISLLEMRKFFTRNQRFIAQKLGIYQRDVKNLLPINWGFTAYKLRVFSKETGLSLRRRNSSEIRAFNGLS